MLTILQIEELIGRIDSGKDVSRRRLYRAIGATALAKMEREWRKEVRSRGYKPPEIVEYARLFGIALRKYGKAGYHSSLKSPKAQKLFNSADSGFERAMEHLLDVVSGNSDLRFWLDREVTVNSPDFGYHPEGMPYPIWSKSPYARGGCLPKRTIRHLKREALEEARSKLGRRGKRQPEPLPDLNMIVRSRGTKTLKECDFSDWKF